MIFWILGGFLGGALICRGFYLWMQGPTAGTDIRKRLDGKVVVITGANTGIGKATAMELSRRGAKVTMLCRDLAKAESAAKEITTETNNEVRVKKLDLASLDSVRQCAEELIKSEDRIDYLINNAGVMACPYTKTADGFEMQFGTNHLGHFLLTELLTPLLKKSAETGFNARIVIVSSMAHNWSPIRWDDINFAKPGSYSPWDAYYQSKLANVLHGAELARRLQGTGITVYSLHPGVIGTDLSRHLEKQNIFTYLFTKIYPLFCKTTLSGAQTTLYCTLEDSLKDNSGRYYSDCEEKQPHPNALNLEHQERLWKISEELVHGKKSN